MSTTTPEIHRVDVDGGKLTVGVWAGSPGSPTVLAAHGITANHVSFAAVADALGGDVTLVAPDLRGRGRSGPLPGPYGITAHVRDMVAVLDHLDVVSTTLLGHSMGAWVAACTAVAHPDRVRSVVLVDGGIALPLPEGIDVDTALQGVLGPSMARLSMTFEDPDAYRGHWQQHPAVGGTYWSDLVRAYVDYDLTGEPPQMRSSVSIDAVRGDAAEQLSVPEVRDAVESLGHPTWLLFAPRGLFDGEPLYPAEALDALRPRWKSIVEESVVEDTNHFTIVIGDGAPAVADALRKATAL